MAGKKKKGAGGPSVSPRSPKPVAKGPRSTAAASDDQERSKELEAAPLQSGPAEETVVAEPPSVVASPSQKVRRKKVDNGDDAGGLKPQQAHEVPDRVEEKHAPIEPSVDVSQGADETPLASSSGEGFDLDSEPPASGAPEADANADHNNGMLGEELMTGGVSEASIVNALGGESAGIEDPERRGPDGSSSNVEEEVSGPASAGGPMEGVSSTQVDPNGYTRLAHTAVISQEDGGLEGADVTDGGAGTTGDSGGIDVVSGKEEGMQNGVLEGGLSVGAEPIETTPLLSNLLGAGLDGGADGEASESVVRVSEALSATLSREDNSEPKEGAAFLAVVTGDDAGQNTSSIDEAAAAPSTNQPALPVLQFANQAETLPSLPTALPMQTPSIAPEPALTPQTASLPNPPKPETSETLGPSPPPAVPQFFSPPRVSLSVASADDDTAFFEQLLEDSDEDEVTSSAMSSLPLGQGVARPQLGGASAGPPPEQGSTAMHSFSTPPRAPHAVSLPQVHVTEHPPAVSPGPIPFGPVSPPELAHFTQHGQGLGQDYGSADGEPKAEGHSIEKAAGAFGSGIQLGETGAAVESSATGPAPVPPQIGIAPPQIAMPPPMQTSPGQNAGSWNFPTPRGEEDVDFFASATPSGVQPQQEQQGVPSSPLPSFPSVDWQQPSSQAGGHFPSAWPHEAHPPNAGGVQPAFQPGGHFPNAWPQEPVRPQPFGAAFSPQEDDVSFFNQDTPKDSQAKAIHPPPPFSNGPFSDAQPQPIAPAHFPTRPQETVSMPSFGFPSPGGDEGALFFEQAAATPPAISTPPPHFLSQPPLQSPSPDLPTLAPPSHIPGPVPSSFQGPANDKTGTSDLPSDTARGDSDAPWIPADASQSDSNPFLGASTVATAPSDAAPGFPNPFLGDLDASRPVSDVVSGGADASAGVQHGPTAVSDAAAVVATATVAAVATAVSSFDFGAVGDDGDVSFFESIGGQEESGGFGGSSAHGGLASSGTLGAAVAPAFDSQVSQLGDQAQYPAGQPYDSSQYWSDQYNQTYDWSQYQQPEGAYSHPSPSTAPQQAAYSHHQEGSYAQPAPSSSPEQGAYSHSQGGAYAQSAPNPAANGSYDPSGYYAPNYDPSASWYGAQGGGTWQAQGSSTWQAQGGDSWHAQGGDTWQQQAAGSQEWGTGAQHVDPEQFFEQIGGQPEPVHDGVPTGLDSLLPGSDGPKSPLQSQAAETALGESEPETLHDLGEGPVPTQESSQESFSPQESQSQPPPQSELFSPGQPEYPPQPNPFSAPSFTPGQAPFSPPSESQFPPEASAVHSAPFFEQHAPPQYGPPVTDFTPHPQRTHSHSALPPRPPGHSRSASATSQTGSEHDWAAGNFSHEPAPAFTPRPPFMPQPSVPAGVNFFQPPKQSGPAFIPAQQEFGGAGFGGGWAQHTAVPRSTAEAMQTSVGRPPCSVAAFGFGGKLIVLRPGGGVQFGSDMTPPGPSFGAVQSSLQIHPLSQVVASNSADGGKGVGSIYFDALGKRAYAGPLAGGHTAAKDLAKWLDERMARCREEETDHQGNPESLRLLYGLLKVAAQHYGKLRAVAASAGGQEKGAAGPEAALAALLSSPEQPTAASSWGVAKTTDSDPLQHQPLEQDLKRTATEMQRLLVAGNRKEALACAKQGQLWGPALVLARQLGDKVFCETVGEMAQRQFCLGTPLRTLHLLLAQQPAEVFAGKKMPAQGDSPMAGGPQPAPGVDQGDGLGSMLDQWQDNLAILAANRAAGDDKVITHLGDSLWRTRGEVAAAHMCYLVAELQPEGFSGTSRVCLVGADQYKYPRTFATPEAIQRTELYEHAKMLGNPQFVLPSFQPYKLLYAAMLAEAGKTAEALRYCQLVLKTLRAGGRSPDVEAIRQGATVLEDRLQNHVRSGAATSSAKVLSGLFKAVDWGIKGIMGGMPAGGSRPTSPAVKEEGAAASPVPSWGVGHVAGPVGNYTFSASGSGNSFAAAGNGMAGTTSGAFLVGHQWAAQVQDPAQQWGENVAALAPPQSEQPPAWGQGEGFYVPPENKQPQQQWGVTPASNASWQPGVPPGGENLHSGRPPVNGQSAWSVSPAAGGGVNIEDAERGGSALSSRPPTPGQSQSWNPSPAVSSGSRPSSPVGQTQSQQWGVQPGGDPFSGGQWAAQGAPLISSYENQAVASTAESGVSKPPTPRKEEKGDGGNDDRRKSPHRSASEPDFAKSGKASAAAEGDKDSGPKSVGGGSSPVRKNAPWGGGFLRAGSGIWGGLKNSLSSVVPVGGGSGNQAKLGDKNKFYYDEKRKKWVLEGEPEPEEEAPLPPPPTAFGSGGPNAGSVDSAKAPPGAGASSQPPPGVAGQPPASQGGTAPLAAGGLAPPPAVPNFSARGRTGVRSRYVDTFNKGGAAAGSAAKGLSLPAARPPVPAPMKFFVPPPAPLGTIPDSESESDPPDQPNSSANPSDPPLGPQSREPPAPNGFQPAESSKPPLPHGHRRSHSSETSGHPPLPPGVSHSAGGAGGPPKAHARSASQPLPPTFMIPGPPVSSSAASGESGSEFAEPGRHDSGPASIPGGYSFALGGGGESTSQGWEGYSGGGEGNQQFWTPPQGASVQADVSSSNFGMPPPPDIGSAGSLQTGPGVWGAGGATAPNVLGGTPSGQEGSFFDSLGTASVTAGHVSGESHAREHEVDEMTDVEL
ncbi:hypothetical protein KFL_000140410 [Klebsormidium nitens]|uniref:Protein transport protein sec16 n=1 Tax=Klebsormidium nitens TaxID=105231 RepID=A0A1Y1HNF7_KLENI|nr:hypothetical protein KFL_000140410 [Klebsormidium nitens]|eukprot:GAQ78521.1 hypothetical protein KFL_000140410 [Klebsormidium nitens]